jgi:hypothetical protein
MDAPVANTKVIAWVAKSGVMGRDELAIGGVLYVCHCFNGRQSVRFRALA